MPQESTTVRVSRRTHQILSELAERRGSSVSDLLDRLVERERRHEILALYNTRMAALAANPAERAAWAQELAVAEVSAADIDLEQHAPAVAR
jgi:predicted DNA-binding ribbon-helix-helix protein